MQVFRSLDDLSAAALANGDALANGSAVAIGKFDGVHRGHQAILGRLLTTARARGLGSFVFTFVNNPLSLLRPEACPRALMSAQQRIEVLAALGVDACAMVEFDERFSSIEAEEFVERVLVGTMRARYVIVGSDFRFGRGGRGDAALLRSLSSRLGFTVEIVQEVLDDIPDEPTGRVSSTAIRLALGRGDVATAARMLGRPPVVRGEVVHGDARGRELGFPTANLGGEVEGFVPADGVYAGWATIDGKRWPTAISVGSNPTFTPEGQARVEAYLLDFEGDLYGRTIEVAFLHRIRTMHAFTSIEALVERMHLDVAETREILASDP